MRKLLVIAIMGVVVGLLSFRNSLDGYTPKGWPKPVYDFKHHPLKQEKVELGRRLFAETLLSRNNTISCVSCHLQYSAFTHSDHTLSHGIDGRIGTRNSPALMNLAWSNSLMWDGAIQHLDQQAKSPISNVLEMDCNMDTVVARLEAEEDYRAMFSKAFGDSLVTAERVMQSLSQFMLTMVSANSKYDRVMNGADTFNEREAHGYTLFKQHCAACHKEPLFTNGEFENNGLMPDTSMKDYGRVKVTGKAVDSFKYKVPTLRNVEVSYPYMHDGRFRNLQMVLFHYSEKVYASSTLSRKLPGKLSLTDKERTDIVVFLRTLTDEAFLRDKKFTYIKQ